jgi:starch synthase
LVLTLHDAAQHGWFQRNNALSFLGDDVEPSASDDGRITFLKGGILAADVVATVAPTYAADLEAGPLDPEVSAWLGRRRERVTGVLNGLDYAIYNPATDSALRGRYDAEDASAKGSCKVELLRAHGLEIENTRPLFVAFVQDSMEEDLLRAALAELLKADASFIIAGINDHTPGRVWLGDSNRLDGICAVGGMLDDTNLRRACAAADFVVSLRRYDPDALIARCAQRYGALPIACATGGTCDAVVDCDAQLETGTGFLFADYAAAGVVGAVNRGIAAFRSPRFSGLRRRVMRLDLGWDRPARRYVQLYRQAIVWAKQTSD